MTEESAATTFVLMPKLRWAEPPLALDSRGDFEKAGVYLSGSRSEHSVHTISTLGALLRGKGPAPAGTEVTIELATGQRAAATIAWENASSFGVGFKHPVDVLALVKRKLVSQPVERRRMPRVEVRCTGWLKTEDEFAMVVVRNISAGGLQIEGELLPDTGTAVTIYLEGLNIPPGELIWKRDKVAGVALGHDLSWALIMPWLRNLVANAAN